MPNRAVVMSGGGAKGAFQVGALDHLINHEGMDFQVICGVSTGSLNATVLAQASPGELKEYQRILSQVWSQIGSDRSIYLKRFLGEIFLFILKNSLYNPDPLKALLRRHASPAKIRSSGRELRVGAVSLESGDYWEVDQKDANILDWTMGSSSMPLFFPPVPIGREHFVDGGVRSVTPLEGAFAALKGLSDGGQPDPPDEMYVILASPLTTNREETKWKTGKHIGMRAAGILVNEIYREDLDYALLVNEAVCGYLEMQRALEASMGSEPAKEFLTKVAFPYRPPDYREVKIFTIVPEENFADPLQFDPNRIRRAYGAGKLAAQNRLDGPALRELLRKTSPRKSAPPAAPVVAAATQPQVPMEV